MRQYVVRPGPGCKSELIVGAGLERIRWSAWFSQFWWLVQWNQGMHQGTNGAWDALWKQAMSRQKKYGWAAYSRPGMQWMKKILRWLLMFSSMVQIWLWKKKTGVIVKVCNLKESEQGTKTAGGAVPWKQLWQFWNLFDGVQGASAGRPAQNWRDVAVPKLVCKTLSKVQLTTASSQLFQDRIWCGFKPSWFNW